MFGASIGVGFALRGPARVRGRLVLGVLRRALVGRPVMWLGRDDIDTALGGGVVIDSAGEYVAASSSSLAAAEVGVNCAAVGSGGPWSARPIAGRVRRDDVCRRACAAAKMSGNVLDNDHCGMDGLPGPPRNPRSPACAVACALVVSVVVAAGCGGSASRPADNRVTKRRQRRARPSCRARPLAATVQVPHV